MFKTIPIDHVNEEYQLEYYNPVGLLFKNHVFLNDDNKILEFDIEEIKRLILKKERDLTLNHLLLIIASLLLIFSIFIQGYSELYRLIGFGLAAIIFLFALAKKTYQYKIILLTKHSHYFTVHVNEEYKDEASELLSLTKKKIKNKPYLKAI